MIGRNLSHYEVLEELGRGGMGVVYKARDTRLGRLVALKILPPEMATNPTRIALLEREARAIAALNHPRIVTIYSVEEEGAHLFLTMEYVEGQTLDKAIPKHGFELSRFLKIAIPLADAVGAAHDASIVHRDLKPSNIVLSKEDRPKILDFGLAGLRRSQSAQPGFGDPRMGDSDAETQLETLEGKLAGTVPYMAPEQLRGAPIDHRTDIFSLGIILHEMATGRHPHAARSGSVVSSILEDQPESVADVRSSLPRQLGRIVRRCLEKEPEERIQSAKDLSNELADLQRELATSGGVVPPPSPARQRYLLPGLAAVAVVLAVAGGLVYDRFLSGGGSPSPYHLAVQESRVFPGDRGPEYVRQGVLEALRWQLTGLSRIHLVGSDGPLPDLVVQVDARRAGQTLNLSTRIVDARSNEELFDRVFEAEVTGLFSLAQEAGRAIAGDLADELERPVGLRPSSPPTRDAVALDLYLQARAAARGGDTETAQRLLGQALELDDRFSWAHLFAGQASLAEYDASRTDELAARAESHCRAAADSDPRLAQAFTCLGDVRMRQRRALDAVDAYRRAIELDTSDLTPHYGLRKAFLDLGLPEDAEQTWLALIRGQPDSWAGYYSLGTYYQESKRYEEAREQYQQALALAPRNPDVYSYLGTVYFYLGRFEEAIVALEDSIEIRPSWDAYYNLGGIYYSLRRFEAAVAAFEESLPLAGSDYRSCHSHGRLGWAAHWAPDRQAESREHLEQAIELAASLLRTEPDDSDTLILCALYQALVGREEASRDSLARALELRPDDAHYFYIAALALNHLGDADASLARLRQAVRGGYSTAEIRTIVDLENLHTDPRFQRLLREADVSQP